MVITATMMRARDAGSRRSGTRPTRTCRAQGSGPASPPAISTIQATPSDRRRPVKIMGGAPGSTMRRMGQERQAQHPADVVQIPVSPRHPTAVLIRGRPEERVTVRPRTSEPGVGLA